MYKRQGCDSIISLNLIIDSANAGSVSQSAGILTTSSAGSKYKWLDCNNGNAPVSTADTNRNFTPTANGSYACAVTNANGCVDTTACFSFNSLGVNSSLEKLNWNIYPNPISDIVYINLPESNKPLILKMIDSQGKMVKEITLNQPTSKIDLSDLSNGIYKMVLTSNNLTSTKSIVVKH